MKLTLYKKCILNNSYSEVFDCKVMTVKNGQSMSILDAYLSGLDSISYTNDFIYTEGNGSFQIELYPLQNADDIYSYNYLKIEEFEDDKRTFKRYCFIDTITKIASDVVVVDYSEDIWSSYSSTMEIRDGVICNKFQNPTAPYYLPAPLDGNNKPTFNSVQSTAGNFMIVCQLQVYKLKEDGVSNNRLTYTVALAEISNALEPAGTKHLPGIYSDTQILNALVRGMADKYVYVYEGSIQEVAGYYYEIDNFTLLPATVTAVNSIGQLGVVGTVLTSMYEKGPTVAIAFLDLMDRRSGTGFYRKELYNFTIENNYQNMSFGSLLSQYEITPNGGDITVKIEMVPSNYDFKLLLYMQNKVIDITNDFVVKMPFTSLNAEENTSKKIQRELATINGVFDIVQGVADTGIQIAGAVMTGGMSLLGGSTVSTEDITKYRYSTKDRQLTSRVNRSYSAKENQASAGGLTGGIRQIANGVTDVIYANKPKYSSTQGTFTTSDGITNAVYGFGVMCINPDNTDYVNGLLKRTGYTVFMPVTSYDEVFNASKYDVIKMNTVILYGDFQQDITYALTEILRTGIRVFRTENVEI